MSRAEMRMAQKRADYFAAGTLVIWDVDLLGPDVIRCFSADNPRNQECFAVARPRTQSPRCRVGDYRWMISSNPLNRRPSLADAFGTPL